MNDLKSQKHGAKIIILQCMGSGYLLPKKTIIFGSTSSLIAISISLMDTFEADFLYYSWSLLNSQNLSQSNTMEWNNTMTPALK